MKVLRVLKRIKNNIIFLCRYDLSNIDDVENDLIYRAIRHTEDLMQTNMVFKQDDSINVLSGGESWEKILASPKSIVRIGDGELTLIAGKPIEFQKYDKRLADYLQHIWSDDRTDLYVGVEYDYFHGFHDAPEHIRRHNYLWAPEFKRTLMRHINPEREYITASFNQMYINYQSFDREKYLNDIRQLFHGRDMVVFAGKGILDGLTHNVFELASSCEYVWSLPRNAFDEFDALLEKARTYPKSKTLCFILGPTSKPLVYELSKDGYTAWDIGHLAKDYDHCLKNVPRDKDVVVRFFAPD